MAHSATCFIYLSFINFFLQRLTSSAATCISSPISEFRRAFYGLTSRPFFCSLQKVVLMGGTIGQSMAPFSDSNGSVMPHLVPHEAPSAEA